MDSLISFYYFLYQNIFILMQMTICHKNESGEHMGHMVSIILKLADLLTAFEGKLFLKW